MPTLTDADARRAIAEDLDDTLVVEAAAGTGKTTELVNRILRVLATGRATMIEIVAVTFTEKAAGELKLRLREQLEDERARRRPSDDVRAAARRRAREARGSARQHHSRLLRRAAARAAGRSARRSAVRGAHRAAGRALYDARVPRLAAGGAARIRRKACGARCGGRARRRSAAATASGPIDRLRSAGRALAEWRDFPAPWRRPPFDREREIDRLVAACIVSRS